MVNVRRLFTDVTYTSVLCERAISRLIAVPSPCSSPSIFSGQVRREPVEPGVGDRDQAPNLLRFDRLDCAADSDRCAFLAVVYEPLQRLADLARLGALDVLPG